MLHDPYFELCPSYELAIKAHLHHGSVIFGMTFALWLGFPPNEPTRWQKFNSATDSMRRTCPRETSVVQQCRQARE